jgi:hypothetical protein
MSTRESILTKVEEISASVSRVLFHKNRVATLCQRLEIIGDIVKNDIETAKNPTTMQAMNLLYTTLEDIYDYIIIFSARNASLVNRIIIYGSDEEQYIKWGERLQHCVDSFGLSSKIVGVFDPIVDLKDFENDVVELRK